MCIVFSIPVLQGCVCFSWDGYENFLHSSWFGDVFWILLGRELLIQECFPCCWAVLAELWRPFLLLILLQQVGCGCTRNCERAQPGQLAPADHWDIPSHKESLSACNTGGRTMRAYLEWCHLLFPCDEVLFSLGWQESCLPMGSGGWVPLWFCLSVAFALPMKLVVSQPMSFLIFPVLSLIPPGGSEWTAECCLTAGWG